MLLHRLSVACFYVRSCRLRDSNISAVEAACILEAEVRKVQGKLAILLRQIDRNLIPHIANLQAITSAKASYEPGQNQQTSPTAMDDKCESSLERRFSQFKKSENHSSTVEKGRFYTKLHEEDWSKKQIAATSGYEERYVSMLMDHTDLPIEIHEMIQNKEISSTYAYEICQNPDYDVETTIRILTLALRMAKSSGKTKITKRFVKVVLSS